MYLLVLAGREGAIDSIAKHGGDALASSPSDRRLAAVLAAEAVSLGGADGARLEIWLDILDSYKSALVGQIDREGGTVIGRSRTGILVEFATIVHAVECALKYQTTVSVRNRDLPAENRIYFRMGLHVGEIVIGDSELTGQGVQTAMQLGDGAEPGDILISGQAYDLIANLRKEFEPAPPLFMTDRGLELRAYRKASMEAPAPADETILADPAAPPPPLEASEDVTVLDLAGSFDDSPDISMVGPDLAGQQTGQPTPLLGQDETRTADGILSEIMRLEKEAEDSERAAEYYRALQVYDEAIAAAQSQELLVPDDLQPRLNRLRSSLSALETSLAFVGDAVFDLPGGPVVLRLADSLEIGRGREGVVIGCNLVSRTSRQTRLSFGQGGMTVTDLGSKNGVFVADHYLSEGEALTVPGQTRSLTLHFGGSRNPPAVGPVCLNISQLSEPSPALIMRLSPSPRADLDRLREAWPSMEADCRLTYVFSTGPVLIGGRDDCALRLAGKSDGLVARLDYAERYWIEPVGDQPVRVNRVDFVRPVVLGDGVNVEVDDLQLQFRARASATAA